MKKSLSCIFLALACGLVCQANPLVFGKSRITLVTPTLVRVEYALDGKFIDAPTMFAYDRTALLGKEEFTVTDLGENRYKIETNALTIDFLNNGYPFGESNFKVHYHSRRKEKVFTNRGIYNENLGASIPTLDKLSGPVPLKDGVLAKSGWYIVDDEGNDLLENGWIRPRNMDRHIQDQYFFIYGDDYKAALRDLGAIGGRVPMTRRYIHGIWFSRYWDYSARDLLNIVEEYDTAGFPLDNVVVDMGWHENDAVTGIGGSGKLSWTGYDWNRNYFPDPEKFLSEMHSKGINVALNDHPHDGVRPSEECYSSFMEKMGIPRDSILLFSPQDSVYMKYFFALTHDGINNQGVDFWWLDWQQNHIYPTVPGCKTSTLKWLNELYFRQSRKNGLRGCNFSRWAGWGDHRHPVQFSGDAHITWPILEFEIKMSSYGCGDGCYYWVHDIGGFKGIPDSEMNVRWTQFGATSAALRIHSTKKAELDRRPYIGNPREIQALRKAYMLRAEIMPYVYSSVRQVHETMIPLNRPMFLDYPSEEQAYRSEQEYMFGDLLLCRPITSKGEGPEKTASATVWFPSGDVWYDWFTDEKYEGGQTLEISKPLEQFPLYQKGGWLLPMQEYCQRPALSNPETIILKVYPSDEDCDNSYTLYEDDGVSRDYEKGRFCKTTLRYIQNGNKARVEIIEDGGNYEGKPSSRNYVVKFLRLDGSWGCAKASAGNYSPNCATRDSNSSLPHRAAFLNLAL